MHVAELQRLAVGLSSESLGLLQAHGGNRYAWRGEHQALAAATSVVAVTVGDEREIDGLPEIDVETSDGAVQAAVGDDDERFWHGTFVTRSCHP